MVKDKDSDPGKKPGKQVGATEGEDAAGAGGGMPPGDTFGETQIVPEDFGVELGPGIEPSRISGDAVGETEQVPGLSGGAGDFESDTEDVGVDAAPQPEFEQEDGTEDVEEVLVLLPEDEDSGQARREGDQGENFTREVTESIERIGLKSVNPLSGTEEISMDDDTAVPDFSAADVPGGYADEDRESVGVIEEITELATSLDEEILAADESPHGEFLDVDSGEDFSEMEEPVAPRRRSRAGALFMTGSLAAAIFFGVYFFPELKELYYTHIQPGGDPVVTAQGGGENNTVDGGGPEAGTVDVPPDGSGGIDTIDRSVTRQAVREKILMTMELGLQWEEE